MSTIPPERSTCSTCGARFDPMMRQRFCGSCGAVLPVSAATKAQHAGAASPLELPSLAAGPASTPPSRDWGWTALGILGLAAVVVIGVLAFTGRSDTTSSGPVDSASSVDSSDPVDSSDGERTSGSSAPSTAELEPAATEVPATTAAPSTAETVATTAAPPPDPAQSLAAFPWSDSLQLFACSDKAVMLKGRFAEAADGTSYELKQWFPIASTAGPRMAVELVCYTPGTAAITSLSVFDWDTATGGPRELSHLLGNWPGGAITATSDTGAFIVTRPGRDPLTNTIDVELSQVFEFYDGQLVGGVQGIRVAQGVFGRQDGLSTARASELMLAWHRLVARDLLNNLAAIFWMDPADVPTLVPPDYRDSNWYVYPGYANDRFDMRVYSDIGGRQDAWTTVIDTAGAQPRVMTTTAAPVPNWDGQSTIMWAGSAGSPESWGWVIASMDYFRALFPGLA